MAVCISTVEANSLAARKGICGGDRLISINGHEIADVLDYRFYLNDRKLTLVLDTARGKRVVTVRKGEQEDIGLQFETYLMDKQHACRNNCIFCFIDQMPSGMRDSLYFKDDDSRLSFLFGNYITLTNLSEHEIARIIDMHISPINISVHTTNPELRCKMMNNRFAGKVLSVMQRFADAGIRMKCQLVLCPNWNDKAELERSMHDLAALGSAVESIAVVPVGLTKHREGLTPLRPFTKDEAAAVVNTVEHFGDLMLSATGSRVVYPADEWYLLADRPLPSDDFYEEMSQLENGVGLIALLRREFTDALADCTVTDAPATDTVLVTGEAAAPVLTELTVEAKRRFPSLNVRVKAIRNDFFGDTITVAGLLTGRDILRQLDGIQCKRIVLPDILLRREGDRLLDDMTPEQIEQQLGITVQVIPTDGAALLNTLLEQER